MDRFNQKSVLNNREGFTLIEVLIAIVLLAFISLYTFKMIDNSTETRDRVVKEDQTLLQSLTAVARIDSDFSQLYSPLFAYSKAMPAIDNSGAYAESAPIKGNFDGRAKNGMGVPVFQSDDKSTLSFLTTANRRKVADTKESRFAWVKYSVRRSENGDTAGSDQKGTGMELIRQTISNNIFADLNWTDVKAQVLLENVKSLEFSFWDERTKKFISSIQDLNENKNTIRSIRMELIWVDENNREQKVEKVYRILHPYFNPRIDDVKGGAYGDSPPPPGTFPNPDEANGGGGSSGGSNVHF